jgi:hypothetical protein
MLAADVAIPGVPAKRLDEHVQRCGRDHSVLCSNALQGGTFEEKRPEYRQEEDASARPSRSKEWPSSLCSRRTRYARQHVIICGGQVSEIVNHWLTPKIHFSDIPETTTQN